MSRNEKTTVFTGYERGVYGFTYKEMSEVIGENEAKALYEELYFLSFRITSRYIVTLDCTCNVRQKSNGLLKSSQSDDVKSL